MADTLASQIFALAKDLGTLGAEVKRLGEHQGTLQTEVATLNVDQIQLAIDELENRTTTLADGMKAIIPLREAVKAVTGQVAQLRADFTAFASTAEEKVNVWDWGSMNQEEAGHAWEILTDWVRQVLAGRYGWVGPVSGISAKTGGQAGTMDLPRIPACWYLHWDAIEELSWLCQEWIKLYTTSYGTPHKLGDWHDRYAPGVRRRIGGALSECAKNNTHKAPILQPLGIDDDSVLSKVITNDLARRPAPPPRGPVEAAS